MLVVYARTEKRTSEDMDLDIAYCMSEISHASKSWRVKVHEHLKQIIRLAIRNLQDFPGGLDALKKALYEEGEAKVKNFLD